MVSGVAGKLLADRPGTAMAGHLFGERYGWRGFVAGTGARRSAARRERGTSRSQLARDGVDLDRAALADRQRRRVLRLSRVWRRL